MNTLLIALTLFAQMQTPPADAQRTASGLVTVKLADGTDTDHPGPDDIVKIRYSITNAEGKVIDSVSGDMMTVFNSCGLKATSQRSTGVVTTSVLFSWNSVVVTSLNCQ